MKRLVYLSLTLLSLAACNRKETFDDLVSSGEDNATMESEFTAAFDASLDISKGGSGTNKTTGAPLTALCSGAIVTYTGGDSIFTDGDGVEFTIDFGPLGTAAPKGLLCSDGRYRAGKIVVNLSNRVSVDGAVLTIVLADFYSGDGTIMTKYEGTKTVTRVSATEFTTQVRGAKATFDDGTSISWIADRNIKLTYDDPSTIILNNVYEVTGSASGTNRQGQAFTVTITEPLKKKLQLGCWRTFINGTLEIKSGKNEIVVDYDPYNNEACDRTAKATFNGRKERTFTVW